MHCIIDASTGYCSKHNSQALPGVGGGLCAVAKIQMLRNIVEHKQHAKVGKQRIDFFTASAIMAVHDKLSPENQAKLAAMPLLKMAAVCLKLVK